MSVKTINTTIQATLHRLYQLRLGTLALVLMMVFVSNVSFAENMGHLWLASEKKELVKINAETGAVDLTFSISDKKIRNIAIDDKHSKVWLASEHGNLYVYDYEGALLQTFNVPDILLAHFLATEAENQNPIVTWFKNIIRRYFDDDDIKHHHRKVDIEDLVVDKRDGSIWLALEHKLLKLSANGEVIFKLPSHRDIDKLALDIEQSRLWVSTEKSVYSINTETGETVTTLVLPSKYPASENDDDDDKRHKHKHKNKTIEINDIEFDQHLGQLWLTSKYQLLRYDRLGAVVLDIKVQDINLPNEHEHHDKKHDDDDDKHKSKKSKKDKKHKKNKKSKKHEDHAPRVHYLKDLNNVKADGLGNVWLATEKYIYLVNINGVVTHKIKPNNKYYHHEHHQQLLANVNDHSVWLVGKKQLTHILADATQVNYDHGLKHVKASNLNGDINAPVLTLVSPVTDALVPRRPEIKLSFTEIGVGVDIATIKLNVNDAEVTVSCTGNKTETICLPQQDLLAETLTLSLSLNDKALNPSNVVSVTVKLDTDGDGVPDYKDTYPEDPTRWRLAAVSDIQTNLDVTAIKLNWTVHIDPPKTKGYVIYRTEFGQTEEKITTEPLTVLEYIDSNVTNGIGYSYRVVAVDTHDYEGEPGTLNNFFVAYNYIPVTNFTVVRNPVAGLLNWDEAQGKRYQLYRGDSAAATQPIISLPESTLTYVDANTLWNLAYYFQISTLADFTDVFTNQAVIVEGPLSTAIELPALPPLGISVYDSHQIADNTFEITLLDPDTMSITGKYTEATGPVSITAVAASDGTTKEEQRSDNKFNLLLPVAKGLNWTVSVSELTVPDRTTTINLTLKEDQEAPVITIEGDAARSVDTESILISGTAIDIGIGIQDVHLTNNRYNGQEFGSILSADNFSAEIPLESGENIITVIATDRMGNQATAQVTVTLRAAVIPKISILTPATGTVFYDNTITVTGEVYTQQAADLIKITLGNQQVFPTQSSALDTYSFSFTNVRLNEGFNPINVLVETPAGNAEATAIVSYSSTPPVAEVTPAPFINITAPRETFFVNATSVIISGDINSQAGISSVTIAGQPVTLVGQTANYKTFQYEYNLVGIEGQVSIDIVATDSLNQVTTKTLNVSNDTLAPVISITTPGIALSPTVNSTNEMPYKLQGSVNDSNLTGFSINGNTVSLLPGATAGSYDFAVDLNLPTGAGQIVTLEAWDTAGNRSSQEVIFDVTLPVQIEIISPRDKTEIASNTTGANIDVVARLTGMEAGYTANLIFDADAAVAMNRDGNVANLGIQTPLNTGEHTITIQIQDAAQQVVSSRSVSVTLKNIENIPLAVERTEPANDEKGVDPNERINVYFNQAIDPSLLTIQVHETVHGKTYDLASQEGKGMGELTLPGLIDIHKEMEALTGTLSQFPGNRYSSFNPADLYNYNADIYVTVNYNNAELHRFNFKVKAVPTIISGLVRDQLGEVIEGIEVSIPELELRGLTDEKGNFSLHSEKAGKTVKGGRYSIIYNPDMAKAIYGTATNDFSLQLGNINSISAQIVPLLNPGIAFTHVRSKQNPVLLANNNMELDLSDATLTFPNGRDTGNLHVQFTKLTELGFNTMKEAIPYWMYAVQPAGIEVSGNVGVKIQMPILFGSYDYVPANGTLVVMLGFSNNSKLIEPVGVGRIQDNIVTSVGKLPMQSMDYFGYAMVETEHQPILQRFADGEISSIELLKSELVQAISQ